MMERQTVWVEVARCTGCGACVDACPVGAMALIDGKARVDGNLSAIIGLFLSYGLDTASGATMVLTATTVFLLSALLSPRRRKR